MRGLGHREGWRDEEGHPVLCKGEWGRAHERRWPRRRGVRRGKGSLSAAFRWRGGSALTPLAISSSRPHDAMHAYMPRQRTKVSLKYVRACRARACARCRDGLPSSMNSRNPCSSIYGVNFARRGAVQVGDDSLYLGIRDGTDVSKRRPRGRGPARGVKKRTKRT